MFNSDREILEISINPELIEFIVYNTAPIKWLNCVGLSRSVKGQAPALVHKEWKLSTIRHYCAL